jgi:hypothetical protein
MLKAFPMTAWLGVTPQNRHLVNYSKHAAIRTMSLWKRTTKQNMHNQLTHYAGGIK